MTLSYEEVLDRLDLMAAEFPPAFYRELSGGVLLLPERRTDEGDPHLFTMGCYCHDTLGRRIELYHGSFVALAELENWEAKDWDEELWATFSHEFTHHLESLAGERGLEVKDELFMEAYHAGKDGSRPPLSRRKLSPTQYRLPKGLL